MLNKVVVLTKIFVKDFYQNTNIVDKETKKLNKKSIYFWLLIILGIVITYISYKAIHLFKSIGSPEIFINIYMLFLTILLMFQTSVICTNVFFFSKELEFVLPLPIKPKELLLAKFNTVLVMSYMTEIIFALVPLILYGFLNYTSFSYFIWLILLLILLPIIFCTIIGLLTIIFIKIFGFIKNKTILQNIISIILVLLIVFFENLLISNFSELNNNNYFMKILIETLTNNVFIEKLKNIFILVSGDIILLLLFVIIGERFYLKLVLNNLNASKRKLKWAEKKEVKIKDRNNKIGVSYIKKEFKMLFKQPVFFIQTVLPVIIILITLIMIINVFIPIIDSTIQSDETIRKSLEGIEFNSEMICIILGILQCLFSISSLSLTAISREGKSAIFIKYIPVSFYRQFRYKNIPQIVLNAIASIIILTITYLLIPEIGLINIALMFIISVFINLINSYLMLIVDLRRPYLNWNSEHSVVKNNDNKSFQYGLTIVMILLYMYISSIFKNINVTLTLSIEAFIFMVIFIIIDRIIKKKSLKLFEKII